MFCFSISYMQNTNSVGTRNPSGTSLIVRNEVLRSHFRNCLGHFAACSRVISKLLLPSVLMSTGQGIKLVNKRDATYLFIICRISMSLS